MEERPRVLIAASPGGAPGITAALRGQIRFVLATAHDQALQHLREGGFRLLVVGYYFDNAQPFRFIGEARTFFPSMPVMLVRALPLPLGATTEADIRVAYQHLGVGEFFNFHRSMDALDVEERRRQFLEAVTRMLR